MITLYYYYYIICLYLRKAGPYRARRGAGTSIFGRYFSNKHVFTLSTGQFWPREHHAVIRLATAISVHKFSSKKALCCPNSSNISDLFQQSLFSTVYSRATAAGTVPRVPGRSTCIDHTRDELRSPYGGRVMIIRMTLRRVQRDFATSESAQDAKFDISHF